MLNLYKFQSVTSTPNRVDVLISFTTSVRSSAPPPQIKILTADSHEQALAALEFVQAFFEERRQ